MVTKLVAIYGYLVSKEETIHLRIIYIAISCMYHREFFIPFFFCLNLFFISSNLT